MDMNHEHMNMSNVTNMPHQHAFILVGEAQVFGVHMTQYHHEVHKYQVIIKLRLPDSIYKQYLTLRKQYPNDTFVLCNAKGEADTKTKLTREFNIPQLGAGIVQKFAANIFQGIPAFPEEDEENNPHFFPWSEKYGRPALGEFEATVERIVTYRPFDHLHQLPEFATYLLFGDSQSGEAHMTNLQSAKLIAGSAESGVFGPDYDHVMSLATCPDWLKEDLYLLEAGIVVSTPAVRLVDPTTGTPIIPATSPFAVGSKIDVQYRGFGETCSITAGPTYLYATAVCNSPEFFTKPSDKTRDTQKLPKIPEVLELSAMPEVYQVAHSV